MALKTRKKRIEAPAISRSRKAKFQADLAPAEDHTVRLLKRRIATRKQHRFLVRCRGSVSMVKGADIAVALEIGGIEGKAALDGHTRPLRLRARRHKP